MSSKGVVPAFVIYGAAMVLIGAAMLLIFVFSFYNNMEITVSDKIADGLSSINYFYLTEKNINEFAQIVTEITAKELGERCGGFDCYLWSANNPSYKDLRDKFESELRGKITGFPAQIGNGGRISFAPPRISGLEMDESNVKISLFPQQVYRKTSSFFVNASSDKQTEIDKNIRYLLLARIGQKLYTNGTYVRDSGRIWINSGSFDCNGDGKTDKTISTRTRLSDSSLNGCKILDIDFNVDDLDGSGNSKWNSYGTNCYNIANNTDAGINAGKVEGEKIYVQIDSLLEKSLICGIDGTDGLASIVNVYGETSKHGEGYNPSCSIDDAKNNAWQNAGIDTKINSILNALKNQISESYSGISITHAINLNLQSGETIEKTPSPWSETCSCTFYDCGTGTACKSSQYCKVTRCDNNLPASCAAEYGSGWCSSANSCSYSGDTNEGSISRTNSDVCTGSLHWRSTSKNWYIIGYFLETEEYRACGSYCYTPDYYCRIGAYFKFTFTPDITFKITDTAGNKIVKKGTTNFEDLYFAVKFKPSSPYVIGDPNYIPPTEYTCEKTSGQTCETSCSASGKTSGSGTCKSGICCKPATANTCISQGGTCNIWASCPADKPLEVPKSSITDCTESNKKCCKLQESKIIITGEGKDITI